MAGPPRTAVSLNWFERMMAAVSPRSAWERLSYKRAIAAAGGYEGGRASRLRKYMRDNRSPDSIVSGGACQTRSYARHLERNHDLARGALKVLVRNVVGPNGITVEPMPRTRDGKVHNDFADQLMRLHRAWSRSPEVTRQMDWPMAQRAVCRAWLRDGEAFNQTIAGFVPGLIHGSPVPFSLELLEADLVPLDFDDIGKNIRQGVECNAWGAASAYHVYRGHPQEGYGFAGLQNDLKRVPADRMLHVALRDRLHQRRGITLFAAVINRLEDIKEISDYEIAAAKIAGALTAVIKRDPSAMGPGPDIPGERSEQNRELMRIEAGMIFDGAGPGEEIQVVDSKRPNSGVAPFLDWNMRNVAAGLDASNSSISRNYNGTYSAQRQELVEVWESYRVLRNELVGYFNRPVYERFLDAALASGLLKLPADLDPVTLYDADFRGPPMPWIQPVQEANAEAINVRHGFKSLTQVIRERGGDPWALLDQIEEERRVAREKGVVLESDPANDSGAPNLEEEPPEDPSNPMPDDPPPAPPTSARKRLRGTLHLPKAQPVNVTVNTPRNDKEDALYERLLNRVKDSET